MHKESGQSGQRSSGNAVGGGGTDRTNVIEQVYCIHILYIAVMCLTLCVCYVCVV